MNKFMRHIILTAIITVFIFGFCWLNPVFSGEESSENGWDTFEIMPYRVISVKGDASKFRANTWMDDGSTGGIRFMRFQDEIGKAGTLTFEGSAIPGDNNYDTFLNFARENGSYVTLQYGNFRKFYHSYGGHFAGFAAGTLDAQKVPVDLEMDIGDFFFEIGSNSNILETVPGVSLSYQRKTKEGFKSTTQWGQVRDSAGRDAYVGPGWQEESVVTDTITLKGNTDVSGVNVSGEQRVDFFGGRVYRDSVYNNGTQRFSQEYTPLAKNLVSTLNANKWLVDDKTYVGFGYRFQHSRVDIDQLVRVYTTSTGVTASDAHNRDVDAQAYTDSHSWVEHFTTRLTPTLNLVTKLKQEILASSGSGFAEGYTAAGSDRAAISENKITRLGESISLRYSGLPKTSIYTDWDFEQTRNWLWRTRVGSSQTEYLNTGPETTGVLGAHYVPNRKVNVTTQYRFNKKRDNFDVFYNDDNGITISRFNFTTHELSSRVSWKPLDWFENSLRLQLGDTVYRLRNLGNFGTSPDWLKSQSDSLKLTYNAIAQAWENWMFNVGYQMNNFKVSTPATQYDTASGGIPTYYANVHTWLMSASYAPTKDLSIFTSGQYSLSHNFDDKSFAGIPYGLEYDRYDVSLGLQWTPKPDITVKPRYAYYGYQADRSLDFGNYSAHAAWLDFSLDW